MQDVVVVNNITCADEEVRLERSHRGEGRKAEALVLLRRSDGGTRLALLTEHELVVVHATAHDERDGVFGTGSGMRGELAGGTGLGGCLVWPEHGTVVIELARPETGKWCANNEITFGVSPDPRSALGIGEI